MSSTAMPDLEQPALAEGERADVGLRHVAQADELDQFLRTNAPLRFFITSISVEKPVRANEDVVEHRHAFKRPVVLERAQDAARGNPVRRQSQ
jgi:hypothetical protein